MDQRTKLPIPEETRIGPDDFKAFRLECGWTQAEAADVFRVSRMTVINWEKGHTAVPADMDIRMAGAWALAEMGHDD